MANSITKYSVVGGVSLSLLSLIVSSNAKVSSYNHAIRTYGMEPDQMRIAIDTPIVPQEEPPVELKYNFQDKPTTDPLTDPNTGGLMLNNPANVNTKVEYDPTTGHYNVNQTMGDRNYRPPSYMESKEYQDYMFKKQVKDYWNARSHAESPNTQNKPVLPKLQVGGEIFDRIFGGNTVDIKPTGSAELIFAYNGTKTDNPAIPERNRKINTFNFDEKIQLNVVGKIGDKLKLTTAYNTEATFDFENQMKLGFTGYDDDILKTIEAGNVSFPAVGSLITGSQTLFGVKAKLQFGRLMVTSVVAQQKGKKSEVEVTGGAQQSKFEVNGDAYDANKHFFLAHYFRDQYNKALENLPFVNSGVNINRIEVWVSNTNTSTTDIRSVVAFADLAEDSLHVPSDQRVFIVDSAGVLPSNGQNDLYSNLKTDTTIRTVNQTVSSLLVKFGADLKQQTNFELVSSARKLAASEYTLNTRLGYISLSRQLNPDQALSVAYQYTIDGKTYQVGEFSDGGISAPQALYTKMLKSTIINTKQSMWDLMMKNVYSIGAYQINPEDFRLDIFYTNKETGTDINYLPVADCQTNIKSRPLIQVLGVDRLNQQNESMGDGMFDFIDGVTINASNGLVIFPVTEPFGAYLNSKFISSCSPTEAANYLFTQLYDSTKIVAQQFFPQFNRFKLKGTYQSSSSSEIMLGAPNVPQGSVTVTAGGVKLTENVDYTVDYALGRVKIINDGILNSGTPIKIALESNSLFAIQQKRLFATHLDYMINKDFTVGATVMNLTERPVTKKVNIGDEPISNTIWGLNADYKTEAPFLTRLVDRIPFIETKEMSTITAGGEFAYLVPGHNKTIGKNGNSYIDDFEGSQSTIDLRSQNSWVLASTPQGQASLFPEGTFEDSLANGYNRAKLAWYMISPEFLRKTESITPSNISDVDMSNNYVREVLETEVFPNKQLANGVPTNISTFDMAYYPSERGPYNYDVGSTISKGLNPDGTLKEAPTRWGGIMRSLQTNDFETSNITYIQFWVMDPFNNDDISGSNTKSTTGDLYFNLGNISEDILRDGNRSSENGLPTPITPAQTLSTTWGQVPYVQPLLNTFNNTPSERPYQDVGFDGLSNSSNTSPTEQSFYQNYLNSIQAVVTPAAFTEINTDPSADDFHYFRGGDYDAQDLKTLERYKKFNGVENNSRTTEQSPESYPTASSLTPNVEDINQDNNLSTVESYYQYHISLKPSDFTTVGKNYITNIYQTSGANIKDGTSKPITWYQFKIPIKTPESKVGTIENFQSIRFFRMFFKGVDAPIVMRFARLELVRGEWRKYGFDLLDPGIYNPNDDANTLFDIAAVNLEENGSKTPVNYVLPPNIDRQINTSSANLLALNEQSLSLTVCDLKDGEARAAFKNTSLDVRSYKKMQMFVHAEASANTAEVLKNNDLHAFVRLGTDYTDNYYEYEIPLLVSAPGYYNGTSSDDQYKVWPEPNDMVLEFAKLQAAKQQRNNDIGKGTTTEYTVMDGTRKITVKGNPNLAAIKTIMIGIRNPKKIGIDGADDGLNKCGQVWVNELRLTDFDESGGGAANAHVTAKLADFGAVSLSGNLYTPGFGSVENKVSERKRATLKQYDITSNFELGKFLPQTTNIVVPMYAGYSETFITPQFNPLEPDMLLAEALKDPLKSEEERKELKKATQDYTERKSINFSNVKKNKGKNATKNHIYDVENLSASYSYVSTFKRNVNMEYDSTTTRKGGLIYSFAPSPKNYTPFSKTKFLQSKYLLLIKDINFSLFPNKLGFSTDVERNYRTSKYRNVTEGMLEIKPTFNKRINWVRNYDLSYPITKALKIDFTATNDARVLEPYGSIDTREKKDTIRNNFRELGITTQYNHQVNANYLIPINKLPFLGFTKASVKYTGTYNWLRSPVFNTQIDSTTGAVMKDTLGNTIQNSRVISWTGDLNMITLYNKIPYFKKINQKVNKRVTPKVDKPVVDPKTGKMPKDSMKRARNFALPVEYLVRAVLSVKNVNVTYAMNNGTILPGYKPLTTMMGMDNHFAGPTPGFIFGSQRDIRPQAIRSTEDDNPNNDWLIQRQSLNTPFVQTASQTLNLRSNIEPFPDLKIELTAIRTATKSNSEFFRWNREKNQYVHDSPIETGTFSMSFLSYRTSFSSGNIVFAKFLASRPEISGRLGKDNKHSTTLVDGYSEGYNQTSQDVLIPAFLAAYSGKNPGTVSLSAQPKIPSPNWRITYDGLSKIDYFKKWFKTVTLSHGYKSTYTIGGYTSNLLYVEKDGFSSVREAVSTIANNLNFYAKDLISTATITENWSPLMKVDIVLHNTVLVNAEYKKDRNLSLGLTSKTITEVAGREIVVGVGYRIKNLSLGKNVQIKGKPIKSDLNLKSDLSFRKNETSIRRIEEGVSQLTAGSNIISIKFSADYVINERINVRLFYDRIINKPVTSNSFPTTNTNAGLSLRLSLSN